MRNNTVSRLKTTTDNIPAFIATLNNNGMVNGLFERLVLEINQAGLSWTLILKKRQAFQTAYKGFDIDTVAIGLRLQPDG